jgi:hypothetical protein
VPPLLPGRLAGLLFRKFLDDDHACVVLGLDGFVEVTLLRGSAGIETTRNSVSCLKHIGPRDTARRRNRALSIPLGFEAAGFLLNNCLK